MKYRGVYYFLHTNVFSSVFYKLGTLIYNIKKSILRNLFTYLILKSKELIGDLTLLFLESKNRVSESAPEQFYIHSLLEL